MRDGPAAGADLDHLDHRNANWEAASLEEAFRAVDLEGPRLERLAMINQTDLGRGSPHVER